MYSAVARRLQISKESAPSLKTKLRSIMVEESESPRVATVLIEMLKKLAIRHLPT
jgi:hypothetical protein